MSITAKSYVPSVTFFVSPLLSLSFSLFLSSSSYGSINCTVLIVMLVLLPSNTRYVVVRAWCVSCMYECMHVVFLFVAVRRSLGQCSSSSPLHCFLHPIFAPTVTERPSTSSTAAVAGTPRRPRAGRRPRPRSPRPRPTRTRFRRWRWWW